ncbi:MAG: hypothetical protein KKD75_02360 [Nanoarchaeota archaeon]|nr:hypothetical protein [Nanoarchaeota archaeon]MBU1631723.1 hypothetical protein [Nanoarchaeota archaeon]
MLFNPKMENFGLDNYIMSEVDSTFKPVVVEIADMVDILRTHRVSELKYSLNENLGDLSASKFPTECEVINYEFAKLVVLNEIYKAPQKVKVGMLLYLKSLCVDSLNSENLQKAESALKPVAIEAAEMVDILRKYDLSRENYSLRESLDIQISPKIPLEHEIINYELAKGKILGKVNKTALNVGIEMLLILKDLCVNDYSENDLDESKKALKNVVDNVLYIAKVFRNYRVDELRYCLNSSLTDILTPNIPSMSEVLEFNIARSMILGEAGKKNIKTSVGMFRLVKDLCFNLRYDL